jgi:hypothetical protein
MTRKANIKKISLDTINYYQQAYKIKPRNSSKATSAIVNCVDGTLRKSRCTGYLFGVPAPRHIKVGSSIQYTLEDLIQWLETNNTNVPPANHSNSEVQA